jgi:hypothetical protein
MESVYKYDIINILSKSKPKKCNLSYANYQSIQCFGDYPFFNKQWNALNYFTMIQ